MLIKNFIKEEILLKEIKYVNNNREESGFC